MPEDANITTEFIQSKIYIIRNQKILLDHDLAELYGVETRVLKQAVRRNKERFPDDFMFELTKEEYNNLRSQNVSSSWGGTRYLPMAFTEQGIAMLSSVLKSKQAVEVNIQIMRVFVKMRKWVENYQELLKRIKKLEKEGEDREEAISKMYQLLTQLIKHENHPKKKIGF
ncbi:MAG TPA: ORF6N domain-containing protein [Balneolales bacterium]|nr:ORF6N domain-containing protein [Balneolales bacterium]